MATLSRTQLVTPMLLATLLISMGAALAIGALPIAPGELWALLMEKIFPGTDTLTSTAQQHVFWHLRLPRVLLGALTGGVLAVSGVLLQGLFRNPVASPGLIGISSGSSLFAAIFMVLGIKLFGSLSGWVAQYGLVLVAFVGACLTGFVVYRISTVNGRANVATMLLVGVAITALSEAVIGLMNYLANDNQLRDILFWRLGSFGGASWPSLVAALPFLILPLVALRGMGKSLNAFALGETEAGYLGIPVQRLKLKVMLIATLLTGATVALAGIIGFVGLVAPHIVRLAVGPDHRLVLPLSGLAGALLLVLSDLFCRTVVAPAELPIGIVTAILGVPVFLGILLRQRRKTAIA